MTRQDIFEITYSYNLEKMFCTLTGRIDRIISLIVLLAGVAVLAPIAGKAWFGLPIMVLSLFQVIHQPARASGESEGQYKEYLALLTDEPNLSDHELLSKFKALQKMDTNPWGYLKKAAHKRTCITLGREDTTSRYTLCEIILSWLAGDLPTNSSKPK